MKIQNTFIAFFCLWLLCACGKPIPSEKLQYVGEWRGKNMYLHIEKGGSVEYWRRKDNVTTSVNAPLQGFTGDDFDVGIWIGSLQTRFVVSKPPYQDGGKWKMVVDGVELTKSTP